LAIAFAHEHGHRDDWLEALAGFLDARGIRSLGDRRDVRSELVCRVLAASLRELRSAGS
jgi:hypothetical protein